jgi:hypothetical protein
MFYYGSLAVLMTSLSCSETWGSLPRSRRSSVFFQTVLDIWSFLVNYCRPSADKYNALQISQAPGGAKEREVYQYMTPSAQYTDKSVLKLDNKKVSGVHYGNIFGFMFISRLISVIWLFKNATHFRKNTHSYG